MATISSLSKRSTMKIKQNRTLNLPPQYNGSNMFMPNGERLYWQAEVLPPPYGPATCQDFEQLRSSCLSEGTLFEDPEFPADNCSLYKDEEQRVKMELESVTWLRPSDLVESPQFSVDGICRFDVNQGELGDCWMDASLATLTMNKALVDQVIPSDQSFESNYAGIFHFRFWQYGRWVDVVIDDRLPTRGGRLIFLKSNTRNEFWSALLEKAYAKLYGSYRAIEGGLTVEALEDFSGGLFEMYPIPDLNENMQKVFFNYIHKAYARKCLLGADLLGKKEDQCGLLSGHAYSITGVKYLDAETPLVRLRNPWGCREWRGPWSDNSRKWITISKEKKEALGLTVKNDGEFWMSFEDFTKYFTLLSVCSINPDFLYPDDNSEDDTKVISIFEGEWVKGETAGGSDEHPESHWLNPQYKIVVTDTDVGDDENECTIIVFLNQKFGRSRYEKKYHPIGVRVYQIEDVECQCPLDKDFFCNNKAVNKRMDYMPMRGFSFRIKVEPGTYVIVPSIQEPDVEGEFLMRVLTEKPHSIIKLCAENENISNEIDNSMCNDINNEILCDDIDVVNTNDISVVYV